MVTTKDIRKLADLSRIEVTDTEADAFVSQIDSILGYIGQISNIEAPESVGVSSVHNVFREDADAHESGAFTENILSQAPQKEGQYFKVKKILQND